MNLGDFKWLVCISVDYFFIFVFVSIAMPVSSPKWVAGNMPWMNLRAKKTCALQLHSHFYLYDIACANGGTGSALALQQTTLTFAYSNESQKSWEVLLNVPTKRPACRALSRKKSEEGRSGMRKDSIVAKELRVQRHPDTGILLNKASIVQRKHAFWHKKWQEEVKPHGASDTYLWPWYSMLEEMVYVMTVCSCTLRVLYAKKKLFVQLYERLWGETIQTWVLLYPICPKLTVLTVLNLQRKQESNGVKQGGGYDDSYFWFCNFTDVGTQEVKLGYHKLGIDIDTVSNALPAAQNIFCVCMNNM